jgi:hypothetical protein
MRETARPVRSGGAGNGDIAARLCPTRQSQWRGVARGRSPACCFGLLGNGGIRIATLADADVGSTMTVWHILQTCRR